MIVVYDYNMWVLPDLPFQFTLFAFWVWVCDVSEVLTFSSVVILHFIEFFFVWSSVFFTLTITWFERKWANMFTWKRRNHTSYIWADKKMQIEFERARKSGEKKTIKNGVKTWTTGIFVHICLRLDISICGFSMRKLTIESMCVSKIIITFRFQIRSIAMHSSHMITFVLAAIHSYISQPYINRWSVFRTKFFVILFDSNLHRFFW